MTLSDKFALESAIEHVDTAYKNFFEGRAAFPKFASKWKPSGNTYTTKWTGNNIRLEEHDGLPYIKLPKVGLVRFILPKKQTIQTLVPHGTSILSVAVKKKGDRYTASLQLETVVESPVQLNQMSVRDIMAADMGIKLFAIIGGEDWEKRYRTHGGSVSMKSVCVACRNPCPERSMTRKPTPALKTRRKPNKSSYGAPENCKPAERFPA